MTLLIVCLAVAVGLLVGLTIIRLWGDKLWR